MVHIVCGDISGADRRVYERLYASASPERRARADRYRRWEDKLRCVAGEALLRRALGTGDFAVGTNPWGKPFVVGREDFHYNLSHSGDFVVIAYGDCSLGVDIQEHRTSGSLDRIARQCFTEAEREYIRQDPERQLQRFYEIWTGKESYLKYIGKGLTMDLRSFCVLGSRPDVRWQHLEIGDGYSLCLCCPETEYTLERLTAAEL